MTGVRLSLAGAEAALATLGRAAARAAQPRNLFDAIGASLVTSTERRFEQERAPDGSPWPPSIRARMEGGRTLFESGRLARSLTHNASDSGVEVGTNALYGAIHQLGGTIRPVSAERLVFRIGNRTIFATEVTLPARPYLGIDREDEQEIESIAEDWLLPEGGGADAG